MQDIEKYIQAWKKRIFQDAQRLEQRRQHALEIAHQIARRLIDRHGAKKVYLFGSVLEPYRFHEQSDIDLAVLGTKPQDYFRILSDVDDEKFFELDLVTLESCSESLRKMVEENGVLLYESDNSKDTPAEAGSRKENLSIRNS